MLVEIDLTLDEIKEYLRQGREVNNFNPCFNITIEQLEEDIFDEAPVNPNLKGLKIKDLFKEGRLNFDGKIGYKHIQAAIKKFGIDNIIEYKEPPIITEDFLNDMTTAELKAYIKGSGKDIKTSGKTKGELIDEVLEK